MGFKDGSYEPAPTRSRVGKFTANKRPKCEAETKRCPDNAHAGCELLRGAHITNVGACNRDISVKYTRHESCHKSNDEGVSETKHGEEHSITNKTDHQHRAATDSVGD